ncbi:hypothetical protein HPB49_017268 [Dermacentor silvarum]|uniref:Uncharacterized protein n=1 Tax=Dermacentor silvarum TaxID=543639 RepID=A0ACB8E1T7_DERSI|nr:hypothetical protein HPB49_017268 [Dermacentor silvarum]
MEVPKEQLSQLTNGAGSLPSQKKRLVRVYQLSMFLNDDTNRQGLGFRMDFSEFYDRQNVQPRTSMTFHIAVESTKDPLSMYQITVKVPPSMTAVDLNLLPDASRSTQDIVMTGPDTFDTEREVYHSSSPRASRSGKPSAPSMAVEESFFRHATAVGEPCTYFSVGSRGALFVTRSQHQVKSFSSLWGIGG